jgi:hypothetical protein
MVVDRVVRAVVQRHAAPCDERPHVGERRCHHLPARGDRSGGPEVAGAIAARLRGMGSQCCQCLEVLLRNR